MKFYSNPTTNEDDVIFKSDDHLDEEILARNPSIHAETKDGFIIYFQNFQSTLLKIKKIDLFVKFVLPFKKIFFYDI
ncbi:MAG: hypothetical protein PHE86_02200 [Candidatus Marinimicrobia bacterium]|nr:hypothetical protein [Candidatus Neomarinimicrobiota bacterium]